MGRAAMEDDDLHTSEILVAMLSISDDDLQAAGNVSESELAQMCAFWKQFA
jgi:hypothetical protein